MKLIVGLGNPGNDYNNTRHNVGFIVVDNYLKDVQWKKEKDSLIYVTNIEGEKVCFLKPQTFMNLSGTAVLKIVNYYDIDINDILVIHDDLDLPIGIYKLKVNSSSGGHNGVNNIIELLHTNSFARLKIGIGKDNNIPTVDYVLGKLSRDQIESLDNDIYKEIITSFIKDGIDKTMLHYNHKEVQ